MRGTIVVPFLVTLFAHITLYAAETPYVLGVEAYKKKDFPEAIAQWSKAAARGNVDAMNNLGFLLFYGYGGDKNPEDAIRLWRTAAYAGHSEAQWHLGTAYESGDGVEKDFPRAYGWYRCAIEAATSKLGSEDRDTQAAILRDAKKSLAKLTPRLSAKELARGKALASEYVRRYGKPAP